MKVHFPTVPLHDLQTSAIDPASSRRCSNGATGTPRDIVLINPDAGDGNGDRVLGDRLAQFARSQGCRVSIHRPCGDMPDRHFSPSGARSHDFKDLKNPLWVVAPANMTTPMQLKRVVDRLCTMRGLTRGDVALIDEMDYVPEDSKRTRHWLRSAGFTQVSCDRLGLSEDTIGYLPLDDAQVQSVLRRAPAELANFMDSLNVDLPPAARLYFGYANNAGPRSAAQFLQGTLSGTSSEGPAVYMLLIGQGDKDDVEKFARGLESALSAPCREGEDPASRHFRRARVVSLGGLMPMADISGQGRQDVTVVLSTQLPQPVFLAALARADEVAVTGDQSLSEALSIRKTLPYYFAPSWKYQMRRGVANRAARIGGQPLEQMVNHRFLHAWSPATAASGASRAQLDQELVAHSAATRLRQLFTQAPCDPEA